MPFRETEPTAAVAILVEGAATHDKSIAEIDGTAVLMRSGEVI